MDQPVDELALLASLRTQIMQNPQTASFAQIERFQKLTASDDFLVMFLRANKFILDRTAERYINYWHTRLALFGDGELLTPQVRRVLDTGLFYALPRFRDREGRQLLVLRPRNLDVSTFTTADIVRSLWVVVEQLLRNSEFTQRNGICFMSEAAGTAMRNFHRHTVKTMLESIQSTLPLRVARIFICNQPAIFNVVFAFISPFLKPKMRNRIMLVGKHYNKLTDTFEASGIPEEVGGIKPEPNEFEDWVNRVVAVQ